MNPNTTPNYSSLSVSGRAKPTLPRRLFRPLLGLGLITVVLLAFSPWMGTPGTASPQSTDSLGLWLHFSGKLHPVILHLPIGALTLVFILETHSLISRQRHNTAVTLGLLLTAITSVLAAIFGHCLYLSGEFEGHLFEEHQRDGILFSIFIIITFLLKYKIDLTPEARKIHKLYLVSLLLSLMMMVSSGHHGGEITHGDPLKALPGRIHQQPKKIKPTASSLDLDTVIYTDIVHPILEAKCTKCHGAKKKKGGLRMDSYPALLSGGEGMDCLVPGNLEKSGLISTLHLPLEDDLHMPPEGKPQLNRQEIKILEWWVSIQAPEKKTLRDITLDKALEETLSNL